MNVRKLQSAMAYNGKSGTEMARLCGMSDASWYSKAKGKRDFTASEMICIREALSLSDPEIREIFFE